MAVPLVGIPHATVMWIIGSDGLEGTSVPAPLVALTVSAYALPLVGTATELPTDRISFSALPIWCRRSRLSSWSACLSQ